jgi:hypothetical protein
MVTAMHALNMISGYPDLKERLSGMAAAVDGRAAAPKGKSRSVSENSVSRRVRLVEARNQNRIGA